ncbi:MAG: NAD-dependent epimerase/dehydratase family protein [Anaerolineae bacterium]
MGTASSARAALVTGGAGFIGSHLAERLLEAGYDVHILDNESTGQRSNVPPGATYQRGDVGRAADVEAAFTQRGDSSDPPYSVVLHVAGQASTIRSFADPGADFATNAVGTMNVVQACIRHRVPRLLFASSMTVYGYPSRVPTPEDEACAPVSYYGISKYAAERFVLATGGRPDLAAPFHATAFRMFNVYGDRQRLDNPYQGVAGFFIGSALAGAPITIHGTGEQSRDFVHIDDVARAWLGAIDAPPTYNRVFNVGEGRRRSINELLDTVLAAVGRSRADYPLLSGPRRPGDQEHMEADTRALREAIGWSPRVSFDEGMRRTIAWARAQAYAKE